MKDNHLDIFFTPVNIQKTLIPLLDPTLAKEMGNPSIAKETNRR